MVQTLPGSWPVSRIQKLALNSDKDIEYDQRVGDHTVKHCFTRPLSEESSKPNGGVVSKNGWNTISYDDGFLTAVGEAFLLYYCCGALFSPVCAIYSVSGTGSLGTGPCKNFGATGATVATSARKSTVGVSIELGPFDFPLMFVTVTGSVKTRFLDHVIWEST
ncbi:hypothetical protein AYO20_00529 [Fonsecaea nubica]|uniref:Uncharacterized protein n=1 Tax=Fonsecaea nubica TaxID=856822 RepID=A0A178DFW9_9EURO|nr:hypothetical protein AYO20_00529 [Fonsecaea nubica]OAL40111.1 hypothetical protein AYO20_00529 [Fonsecaea nubica]